MKRFFVFGRLGERRRKRRMKNKKQKTKNKNKNKNKKFFFSFVKEAKDSLLLPELTKRKDFEPQSYKRDKRYYYSRKPAYVCTSFQLTRSHSSYGTKSIHRHRLRLLLLLPLL